ncbi:MAG: DUF4357 domain-containing protein [Desulfobacteraceae bacterium]
MFHKYGKTIKLFLLDADPDGRMICELSNWTGKAYRIPRGKVKDCSDRAELKSTAVYLLFGKAESSTRDELLETELIKEHNGRLIFEADYLFSSPSAAAAVFMGRSANGLIEWKDKKGRDLKLIETQEIQKANKANAADAKSSAAD